MKIYSPLVAQLWAIGQADFWDSSLYILNKQI